MRRPSDERVDAVRDTARTAFGWEEFRPGQREAIDGLLSGRDVLATMPTGYGKSAIYQVASLLLDGITVVVSPLIALQADQVAGIAAAPGAPDAVAVNSSQSDSANDRAWTALAEGKAEFLFLAPEQLAKEDVVARLTELTVSLFVVDEAHCVSAWGHDFRPDYLGLGDVIDRLGRPTALALTATGSGPVREEIVERLGMTDPLVLTRGFDRPNIRLEVHRHESDAEKRRAVVDAVLELPKPGLVYAATRRDTERYAEELSERGMSALAYHAGLSAGTRREVHEAFLADTVDVVVATSAFGMGIDKPNVRFVVHAAITDSLDSYYQEIGRSGRNGDTALASLHYRAEDLGLRVFFASRTPDEDALAAVLRTVADSAGAVSVARLSRDTGLPRRKLTGLISLLEEADALVTARRGRRLSGSLTSLAREEVEQAGVAAAVATAESRERIDESRLAMMRAYAETTGCRRRYILGYFGEDLPEPCGNCDTCSSGSAYDDTAGAESDTFPPQAAVRHRDWGDGVVMHTDDDRITVFFENEGYKVLSIEAILSHRLLERT
ncbi:MAG: RecQ family ATP-dependent DNA helicase [Mycetocola sp.]